MKKILVLFLSLLALVFVACGKDKDIRDILDKVAIGSQDELSEKDLFEILKEAKSFIKK